MKVLINDHLVKKDMLHPSIWRGRDPISAGHYVVCHSPLLWPSPFTMPAPAPALGPVSARHYPAPECFTQFFCVFNLNPQTL